MPDRLTTKQRSELMSRVRAKNTTLELRVFAALKQKGIYFRRHYGTVAGTPDIAKPREKKAVFIHSDFWHGWQFPRWKSKLSTEYWRTKIERNRKRDRKIMRLLRARGWKVIVVWEHSLRRDAVETLKQVERFLRASE